MGVREGWNVCKRKKTKFLITRCSIVCRGEFLTLFSKHWRIEYDGCQKGDNPIAFMHKKRKSVWPIAKGFCSETGDMKYPCVSKRKKLPGKGVHNEKD